jgi:hypothetical protein
MAKPSIALGLNQVKSNQIKSFSYAWSYCNDTAKAFNSSSGLKSIVKAV